MLDPPTIIATVKSGSVPATWRVLRPSATYPLRSGCFGAFFTLFALCFIAVVSIIVRGAISVSSGVAEPSNPLDLLSAVFPLPISMVAMLAVFAVIAVGLWSSISAAASVPSSYFVFTPEGAVQTTGSRAITAIDYAQIDVITPRYNVTRTVENTPIGTSSFPMVRQTTTTRVNVSIELHYRDGRTRNWRPASRFGSAESICQRLVNGLQAYSLHTGGMS